jgi:hypothetical protein
MLLEYFTEIQRFEGHIVLVVKHRENDRFKEAVEVELDYKKAEYNDMQMKWEKAVKEERMI